MLAVLVAVSFAAPVEKVDFFIALHRSGDYWGSPRGQVKKVSIKLHSISHSSQRYDLFFRAVNIFSIENQWEIWVLSQHSECARALVQPPRRTLQIHRRTGYVISRSLVISEFLFCWCSLCLFTWRGREGWDPRLHSTFPTFDCAK